MGHHSSQAYCLRQLDNPPEIPRENRACVLVYERHSAGAWSCVQSFPGTPK